MFRSPPKKKVPPDPKSNSSESAIVKDTHLGWSSTLSQSSNDSSNSENRTIISVGANVTINDDNGFQEVLSRSSKKRKKISPIKSISPLPAQDPPSKNLGIYLKFTPTTPFKIKKDYCNKSCNF